MSAMTETQSGFWSSVPSSIRTIVAQALPAELLNRTVSGYDGSDDLGSKCRYLANKMQSYTERPQFGDVGRSTSLHALGLLRLEQGQHLAAEDIWRSISSRQDLPHPDLAAKMNLAFTLNKQKKYAEAEEELRHMSEVVETRLGRDSPQGLGLKRMLVESLAGQGKMEEAGQMYIRTEQLVNGLSSEGREMEREALQAVKLNMGLQ